MNIRQVILTGLALVCVSFVLFWVWAYDQGIKWRNSAIEKDLGFIRGVTPPVARVRAFKTLGQMITAEPGRATYSINWEAAEKKHGQKQYRFAYGAGGEGGDALLCFEDSKYYVFRNVPNKVLIKMAVEISETEDPLKKLEKAGYRKLAR